MNIKNFTKILLAFVLSITIVSGVRYVLAAGDAYPWVNPTDIAPKANISTLLDNTSTPQSKAGSLSIVGAFIANQNSLFKQNVGISAFPGTAPQADLHINNSATYSTPSYGHLSGAQLVIGETYYQNDERLEIGYDTNGNFGFINAGDYTQLQGHGTKVLKLQPDGGLTSVGGVLQINGTTANPPALGKVLTSDANGYASWKTLSEVTNINNFTTLDVTGDTTIGGGLTVTGPTILNGGLTIPGGTDGQVLTSDANGKAGWENLPAAPSAPSMGSGTAGRIVKWLTGTTITDSIMSENGSMLTINGGLTIPGGTPGQVLTSGTNGVASWVAPQVPCPAKRVNVLYSNWNNGNPDITNKWITYDSCVNDANYSEVKLNYPQICDINSCKNITMQKYMFDDKINKGGYINYLFNQVCNEFGLVSSLNGSLLGQKYANDTTLLSSDTQVGVEKDIVVGLSKIPGSKEISPNYWQLTGNYNYINYVTCSTYTRNK